MDKAFEKIKILKQAIHEKTIEYEKQEKAGEDLFSKSCLLNSIIGDLEWKKSISERDKSRYLHIQKNIKKWKKQTIILSTISLLWLELVSFGFPLLFNRSIDLPIVLLIHIIGVPSTIISCEVNDYYSKKKYLKQHNLSDIESKIKEYEEEIDLNKKEVVAIGTEFQVIYKTLNDLSTEIDKMKLEVNSLEKNRTDVINNYIANNKELDASINNEVNEYYEEKNKVFTKKKQESK